MVAQWLAMKSKMHRSFAGSIHVLSTTAVTLGGSSKQASRAAIGRSTASGCLFTHESTPDNLRPQVTPSSYKPRIQGSAQSLARIDGRNLGTFEVVAGSGMSYRELWA